ncbi:uncharacterized protein LOC123550293 [Mercenaria mercenaria]|uniref:uncharacterized protein LOC123550293 n=1 Tax=Mercenaria mercenaria TaxID=6596 RepID=UPI00234F2253|nr:uncharacterized protein LOC123550293 [Mercenaria mercenaria]
MPNLLRAVVYKMRFKTRKYFKISTLCCGIVVLFYTLFQSINRNIFKPEFLSENDTLSQQFSLRSIHVRRINDSTLDNHSVDEWNLDNHGFNVVSTCKQTLFPFHLARKNSWSATDSNKTAYVFSAYLFDTNKTVIIGIKTAGSSKFYCQFWYQSPHNQNVKMKSKLAKIITISEGLGLRYTALLFQCMLPQSSAFPTHVSIVSERCETPMNLIDIQFLRSPFANKHRFTVCLTPLNFRYNRDYEILEWIELNRILGADKFIVYNYSSTINVAHVLEYYSKRGLTEVVQWNLPVGVDTWPRENKSVEIHYFGQVAALQDCLYRNKGVSEFIVNLDVDEFIIPHGKNVTTWSDMLRQLKHDSIVYMFRNTFFKKEWNNTGIEIHNKSLVDKLRLVTLRKLQHERKLSLPKQRSKYFAKTAGVSKVMIHEVPEVTNLVVPINIGLLHHYRNWETLNDPPQAKVLDKTVPDKFSESLIKNVLKVRSDLQQSPKGIQCSK